jgi:GNAT superfamily N-acetyltransferase
MILNKNMVDYKIENNLNLEEFRDVLLRSTLAERRPIEDRHRLEVMLKHGNLIVTARIDGRLIGIARSLTDFQFCSYLSDLAVDEKYQKMGIGKELIRQTKLATPNARLILLAAPAAINYYPKTGMKQFEYCFLLDDVNDLVD